MKKGIKKAGVGILTGIMALSAFAFGGCDFNSVKDTVKDTVNDITDSITGTENESVKPSYDGTVLTAGETYDFGASPKMAFCSAVMPMSDETGTETQEFETISVTVKATVLPADANQNVSWHVVFANAESEWATGKTVTDYVEVTPTYEGSTTATLSCKKSFGEQIKLVCTSVENAEISASVTVDFIQTIELQSLTYGDNLPINFGGVTNVAWEVSTNGVGVGGAQSFAYKYSQAYTIANEVTTVVDLVSPNYYHNGNDLLGWGDSFNPSDDSEKEYKDGYFQLYSAKWGVLFAGGDVRDCGVKSFKNITDLRFDRQFLTDTCLSAREVENSMSSDIDYIFQEGSIYGTYTIEEGSLYTLRLRMTHSATGEVVEKMSLINVTEFTSNAQVASVTLSGNVVY